MRKENTAKQTAARGAPQKGLRIPNVINRNSLLELLSISGTRFDRLLRDGAPVVNDSSGGFEINVADFVDFMIKDAVSKATGGDNAGETYDQAKKKDKSIQASIRELDLLKRQGELVDIEDVRPLLRETFAIVRSRMLAVRSQIQGVTPEQARQIDDAINDALTDLSGDKIEFGDDAKASGKQPKH